LATLQRIIFSLMTQKFLIVCALLSVAAESTARNYRWQQRADYTMNVELDDKRHTVKGNSKIVFSNNSPDDLNRLFFHLYFNAFAPGSMMDMRTRSLPDPDDRLKVIGKLEPDQIGWSRVRKLSVNGRPCELKLHETILEVLLPTPVKAKTKVTIELEWEAQVPIQIRRSGRSNAEGIAYSMAQWYPKLCNYDEQGWHAHPYVGREFYGIWGDFEVNITLPRDYVVAATGTLTNAREIGKGYAEVDEKRTQKGDKILWRFKAENVHDFVWAADKDYIHETKQVQGGPLIRFFYQEHPEFGQHWRAFQDDVVRAFEYMSAQFGKYPWPVFSVIQGGDGGMEYPMATLITGHRSRMSLLGVTVHEAMHMWYYGALASNESLHEWMDEGMTTYASSRTMAYLRNRDPELSHENSYMGYSNLLESGNEEPLSTHADHYQTNQAYGQAAYSKGEVFMAQLAYVIGRENVAKGLLEYFDRWKFRHPNPTDLQRVMEDVSGIGLDWYFRYMINSTHHIDYSIEVVMDEPVENMITVGLERKGNFPMPIDFSVELSDGRTMHYHIPLDLMYGAKPKPDYCDNWTVLEPWPWTNKLYFLSIPAAYEDISILEIDSTGRLADKDRSNNYLQVIPQIRFLRN
jgi:hypothetical protein